MGMESLRESARGAGVGGRERAAAQQGGRGRGRRRLGVGDEAGRAPAGARGLLPRDEGGHVRVLERRVDVESPLRVEVQQLRHHVDRLGGRLRKRARERAETRAGPHAAVPVGLLCRPRAHVLHEHAHVLLLHRGQAVEHRGGEGGVDGGHVLVAWLTADLDDLLQLRGAGGRRGRRCERGSGTRRDAGKAREARGAAGAREAEGRRGRGEAPGSSCSSRVRAACRRTSRR